MEWGEAGAVPGVPASSIQPCRDALGLSGDLLIDRHSRYALCRKHGIPFEMGHNISSSRWAACIWNDREPFVPVQRIGFSAPGAGVAQDSQIIRMRAQFA